MTIQIGTGTIMLSQIGLQPVQCANRDNFVAAVQALDDAIGLKANQSAVIEPIVENGPYPNGDLTGINYILEETVTLPQGLDASEFSYYMMVAEQTNTPIVKIIEGNRYILTPEQYAVINSGIYTSSDGKTAPKA